MNEVISSYKTRQGEELFYRSWKGSRSSPSCLIFVHGIESHSGWFQETGERLSDLGLEVYALDRRGSGLNKEGRGHLTDFRILSYDLEDFLAQAYVREKECILVGMCWGAKAVLCFLLLFPPKVARVIFITPGLKTKLSLPFLKKMKWLGATIFTPFRRLALPITPEMFTLEKKYLEKIKKDELKLTSITGSFFRENLRLDRALKRLEADLKVKVLLLLAGEDRIIDNEAVVIFLRRYFKNFDIISYPETRHGLLFEPVKEKVISDMVNWVRTARN